MRSSTFEPGLSIILLQNLNNHKRTEKRSNNSIISIAGIIRNMLLHLDYQELSTYFYYSSLSIKGFAIEFRSLSYNLKLISTITIK